MAILEYLSVKRLLLLFAVAFLGLTRPGAGSQFAGSIEHLEVTFWPEYDRQAVLVMYHFRLKPDSILPTTVAVPIPTSVRQPHAVAWRDENGTMLVAEFTREVKDDRAMMLVRMHSLEGQLEYYEDLTLQGPKRTFLFSWPGGVDLDFFSYKVQRPVGSRRFEISPPPDRQTVGRDGFTYEWIDHGPLEAAERPTIELRYEKDTAALSVQSLEPSRTSSSSTSAREASTDDGLPRRWLLASFGGLFLGLVMGWHWWSTRKPSPGRAPDRQSAGTKPLKKQAGESGPNFCHNCGKKAETRANFCMACGTQLHR